MRKALLIISCLTFTSSVFADAPKLKSKENYKSDSQQICTKKWTKRGELDHKMYNYCIKYQMEGYERVKGLHVYADQYFYSNVAYPYCINKWTKRGLVDTSMLAYCLENEIEGIQDVMYYRKRYDEAQINKIVDRALSKYGSWNMVAYSVKQATE